MKRQSGAVLVVSLIMLLVMTLIGVTAMRSTTMEEKMAGNSRDHAVAFQAAESALRQGEETDADISAFNFDGANGTAAHYAQDSTIDTFSNGTWSNANSLAYDSALHTTADLPVDSAPRYVLQYRGELPLDSDDTLVQGVGYGSSARRHAVRVISRGTGTTDNTKVYLQSDSIVLR
jgi:type IV pilus assembly protein PilX